MTAAITKMLTGAASYLSPHHCNLRQLDDIGPHGVEHILQLVYHGDKSLHVCWSTGFKEALCRDGAKVIQCPPGTTIATTETAWSWELQFLQLKGKRLQVRTETARCHAHAYWWTASFVS